MSLGVVDYESYITKVQQAIHKAVEPYYDAERHEKYLNTLFLAYTSLYSHQDLQGHLLQELRSKVQEINNAGMDETEAYTNYLQSIYERLSDAKIKEQFMFCVGAGLHRDILTLLHILETLEV